MKDIQKYIIIGAMMLAAVGSQAENKPTDWGGIDFLDRHCFECHDDDVSKGDLNLLDLPLDPTKPANFSRWERVFDRVREGEMPPRKKKQPTAIEKQTFLQSLRKPLIAADTKAVRNKGRVPLRRLTRREYQHTVHDLLHIDLPLSDLLPEDPATHGFETVASGQQLSHHNLARYLEAADQALAEAFKRAAKEPKPYKKSYAPSQLGAKEKGRGNYRGPQHRGDLCIHWPMRVQFYGRMPETEVPASGWYRVTLKGLRAINPQNRVVWGTLQSGVCYSNSPLLYPIASIEATAKPKDYVFNAWIQEDHGLRLIPNDATLKTAGNGATGGQVSYKDRDLEQQGYQGLAHTGIEVERIYPNGTRWEVRKALFAGVTKVEVATLKQKKQHAAVLNKIVGNFARRAFRRPVSPEQLAPYLALANEALDEKETSAEEALRVTFRAILCSPRFLTFIEKPGKLDDHAIASRLSYMLWNSMPDATLIKAANQGKLGTPAALKQQVDRMLADARSERFITAFTDQWLTLRDINITSPDLRMFRMWDPIVQDSMLKETRAFVAELINKNLSVRHFIQSDFGMLNERLVRHYQLTDLDYTPGEDLQKVSLAGRPRGGLITQGAILKVTANGTTTSPVIRGVWVNERLLGTHIPPPPPGVPAIEPDIRGAVSIRDQLDKHRNTEACMSCHLKIDPAGFALEQLDPVGRWRGKYGTHKKAAVVDASGVTPGGKPFKDIVGWKQIYLDHPQHMAKGFTEQLLTYATGAPVQFSDRDSVWKIMGKAKKQNYGLRTILKEVVSSEPFLHK